MWTFNVARPDCVAAHSLKLDLRTSRETLLHFCEQIRPFPA